MMLSPSHLLRALGVGVLLTGLVGLPGVSLDVDASHPTEYSTPVERIETKTTSHDLSVLNRAWAVPTPPSTTRYQDTALHSSDGLGPHSHSISNARVPSPMTATLSNTGLVVLLVVGILYAIRKLHAQKPKNSSIAA